ncbi:MAG: DUF4340 domain-containing protein [Spirochaetales bacterium]|nr:DUF4340 domain-containing protein [Spirochaetales bacterium]
MKKNLADNVKIYILAGVTIFLSITLLAGIFTSGKYGMKSSKEKFLLKDFDQKNILEIVIRTSAGEVVTLEKDSDLWTLLYGDISRKANQNEVKNFLSRLKKLQIESVASSRVDSFGDFGINDKSSQIRLIDKKGSEISLLFGDTTDANRSVFVNFENGKKLYKVENLKNFINRQNRSWADLNIFKDIKSDKEILSFSINGKNPVKSDPKYSQKSFDYQISLIQEDNQTYWKGSDSDEKLNNSAVSSLLSTLANLQAYDYAESSYEFGNPLVKVDFETSSGIRYTLEIGEEDSSNSQYYAKTSNSSNIFKISKWNIEKIIIPLSELKK